MPSAMHWAVHPSSLLWKLPAALLALASLCAHADTGDSESASDATTIRPTLLYPKKFAEAPALFDSVTRSPLISALGIQKAELLEAFDATEKPLQHQDSAPGKAEGAHAADALVGDSGGIMLWGPYAKLDEGHYLVVYRFKLSPEPTPNGTLFLDVCHNACTRSGVKLDATKQAAGQWQEIAIPVDLPEAMELEFRFWPDGNTVALDRLYVFKITSKPDGKPAASDEAIPEARPVNGRTDVVRSPHTDDPGLIDVSGLAKGAKVLCPYTGKYFRVP